MNSQISLITSKLNGSYPSDNFSALVGCHFYETNKFDVSLFWTLDVLDKRPKASSVDLHLAESLLFSRIAAVLLNDAYGLYVHDPLNKRLNPWTDVIARVTKYVSEFHESITREILAQNNTAWVISRNCL